MAFFDLILDTIFPPECVACGKKNEYLCNSCMVNCPPPERKTHEWIYPLFDYRHPAIRKSVWLIKYTGKKKVAHAFGEVMYRKMLEEMGDLYVMEKFMSPLLIPIPLSGKRKRKRGFNQAEILCREIISCDKRKYLTLDTNILSKVRETSHQAHTKNKEERLKNLTGTFKVSGEVKNRNIILVDDVATTGATLLEAKQTLENAGARKVIAFTIAH